MESWHLGSFAPNFKGAGMLQVQMMWFLELIFGQKKAADSKLDGRNQFVMIWDVVAVEVTSCNGQQIIR